MKSNNSKYIGGKIIHKPACIACKWPPCGSTISRKRFGRRLIKKKEIPNTWNCKYIGGEIIHKPTCIAGKWQEWNFLL